MKLEDETYLVSTKTGQLPIFHTRQIITVYEDSSGRGLVKGPHDIEQGRLSRAGRTGDYYKLPLVKSQAYSSKGMDYNLSEPVGLLQILHLNEGVILQISFDLRRA